MSVILLVPGLISLFLVLRGRIETAFLSVYLPCLLLLPDEYSIRIPHLPPTSAAQFALIPLGVVGLVRLIRSGSFAPMDLLVVLFSVSISLSEILHVAVLNDGIFSAMTAFITIVLAYMAGRQLVEPNLRFTTVRRIVILILMNGLTGVWEWRMGQNPYGIFGQRFLGLSTLDEHVQQRNGYGRMGAVFGGGECGGIAFAMTFCLNAWLVYLGRMKASFDFGMWLTILEKYHVPGALLLMYLLMSQSRGPEIALAAGFLILQIPRFKHTRVVTILVAILLVGGYLGASAYFASYTNVADSSMSEQQSSAKYRRIMNELYPPIAEKGGWTGYSVLGIPHVPGLKSIDNHYLLVHLAWGRFGYISFLLIVLENMRVLLMRSWQFKNLQDRAFAFSMLAAMSVLWFTLLTVFLGSQLPQVAFFMVGWIQSTGQSQARGFSFRRVFT